jgi:hypothetical protein
MPREITLTTDMTVEGYRGGGQMQQDLRLNLNGGFAGKSGTTNGAHGLMATFNSQSEGATI